MSRSGGHRAFRELKSQARRAWWELSGLVINRSSPGILEFQKKSWRARILANLGELVSHYGGNGHGKTIVRFSNTRNIEQTPSNRPQVVNRWD